MSERVGSLIELADEDGERLKEDRDTINLRQQLGERAALNGHPQVFGVELMTQVPVDAVSDTGSNPIPTNNWFDKDNEVEDDK